MLRISIALKYTKVGGKCDGGGRERKQRAGSRELRGLRRQGSGFRYYLGVEFSHVEQFLNPAS
jgi:hypothetical protein